MKILLGDNQFFGVNHSNLKKAVETQKLFSSSENIIEFIKKSHEIGINGFMINSNDLGYKVVAQFPFMSFPEKECHFSIPYPHKYAALVNETGIPKKLFELLSKICVKHSFRLPPNQLPIDEVHSCLLNAREKRIQTIYDIWKELNEISEKKYWIF